MLAVLSAELPAFDTSDPFATRDITPERPALRIDDRLLPCQVPAADAPYGIVEVVDLALCRNPTTREVWSAARVQAAGR